MTVYELDRWLTERGPSGRTHYAELVSEAFRHTRVANGARRSRNGKRLDTGQTEARRLAQDALDRALTSETFARLDPEKVWPWLSGAIESEANHASRGRRRAKKALKQWSGAFISEDRESGYEVVGYQALPGGGKAPVHRDTEQHDDESGHRFLGPRGRWQGEYTISQIPDCSDCASPNLHRLEIGRDQERAGYSKRQAVELLLSLWGGAKRHPIGSESRLAYYLLGCIVTAGSFKVTPQVKEVTGCWSGHRVYYEVTKRRRA